MNNNNFIRQYDDNMVKDYVVALLKDPRREFLLFKEYSGKFLPPPFLNEATGFFIDGDVSKFNDKMNKMLYKLNEVIKNFEKMHNSHFLSHLKAKSSDYAKLMKEYNENSSQLNSLNMEMFSYENEGVDLYQKVSKNSEYIDDLEKQYHLFMSFLHDVIKVFKERKNVEWCLPEISETTFGQLIDSADNVAKSHLLYVARKKIQEELTAQISKDLKSLTFLRRQAIMKQIILALTVKGYENGSLDRDKLRSMIDVLQKSNKHDYEENVLAWLKENKKDDFELFRIFN